MSENDIVVIIEDGEYVALAGGYPSLSWIASTPTAAREGMERLLEHIEDE